MFIVLKVRDRDQSVLRGIIRQSFEGKVERITRVSSKGPVSRVVTNSPGSRKIRYGF